MKVITRVLLVFSFLLTTVSGGHAEDSADYKILPGDVLQITVWKEDGMDRELVVLPDGSVSFPLIGTVSLQSLTLGAAQDLVKERLKSVIPDAAVTVMVKSPLGHTVSVLGQVVKSGDIVISRRMNAMQAISLAGGLTPFASEGNIVILRNVDGKKTSIDYPYDDIAQGDDFEKDVDLVPGDVVFVPTAGLF